MRELITWQRDYEGGSRQVARLGGVQVGAIIATDKYTQWIFWLPTTGSSSMAQWVYVKTEDTAKACVTKATFDWLARAGVIDLAERDRAHAADLPLFADA